MLEPSVYTCYVLSDDRTWEQPTYRTAKPMTEAEFANTVLRRSHHDCFAVFGITEDLDCDEQYIQDLPPTEAEDVA